MNRYLCGMSRKEPVECKNRAKAAELFGCAACADQPSCVSGPRITGLPHSKPKPPSEAELEKKRQDSKERYKRLHNIPAKYVAFFDEHYAEVVSRNERGTPLEMIFRSFADHGHFSSSNSAEKYFYLYRRYKIRGEPPPQEALPEFREALINARTKAGLSQSELSRRSGTWNSEISEIERGLKQPHSRLIEQLAAVLPELSAFLENGNVMMPYHVVPVTPDLVERLNNAMKLPGLTTKSAIAGVIGVSAATIRYIINGRLKYIKPPTRSRLLSALDVLESEEN